MHHRYPVEIAIIYIYIIWLWNVLVIVIWFAFRKMVKALCYIKNILNCASHISSKDWYLTLAFSGHIHLVCIGIIYIRKMVKELIKKESGQRSGIDTIKHHTWPKIPMGKWQLHNKTSQTRAKRSALSQQVNPRYQRHIKMCITDIQ